MLGGGRDHGAQVRQRRRQDSAQVGHAIVAQKSQLSRPPVRKLTHSSIMLVVLRIECRRLAHTLYRDHHLVQVAR